MMYLEFNWTANVYQPRFGDTFTDVGGYRSFASLEEARWVLATCKLKLGRKTDSRTWPIECIDPIAESERPGGCGAAVNPVERNYAADNAAAWYRDIADVMGRYTECEPDSDNEAAMLEIQEGPLSVLVRDGWRSPYGQSEGAEEYEILLSTGGPALRVYGRLGMHGEPDGAVLQYQDWGTPWTDWYPEGDDVERVSEVARVLLAYARCFSFGE